MSVSVQLNHITKAFDTMLAVNDISLTIAPGELFFLLGPSGCGKSTLLRVIAGFYHPDGGELRFDDEEMNNVPPHQRNTGMVFQNYALWPHMTVSENIEYGLRLRKLDKSIRNEKITTVLEMVEMSEYRDRPVNTLSGGQQQRIALARALVIEPSVLLLDEPLSNLDAALRQNLRDEMKEIHNRTQITTIYVTHDQVEAISMADRMAIMKDGVFVQVGTPREIYQYPADPFVASFVGETNFISGKIQKIVDGKATIETPVGVLHTESVHHKFTPGQEVSCSIRPETIHLNGNSTSNQLTAKVRAVTYLGRVEEYELRIADTLKLKVIIHNPGTDTKKPGETVNISISPKAIVPLPINN
jgi:iron(III) transport system ATP-binding protein